MVDQEKGGHSGEAKGQVVEDEKKTGDVLTSPAHHQSLSRNFGPIREAKLYLWPF